MSQEYVTSLFNGSCDMANIYYHIQPLCLVTLTTPNHLIEGYAARFESELVGKLEYRGHEHVVEELAVALTHTPSSPSMPAIAATTSCTVVDCGCGTGLCG